MHLFIDIMAVLVVAYFFMNGFKRGMLLSLLGVARILVSLLIASIVGKYLGHWLADTFYRPRLVTIPTCGFVTFSLFTFIFRIAIIEVRGRQQDKAKNDELKISLASRFAGGTVSVGASILILTLLFWMTDLFFAGFFGTTVPGANDSKFADAARRTVYEISYRASARDGKESQAAAMAQMISNPNKGFQTMEQVLKAESVQQLVVSAEFAEDFLSGDTGRIERNPQMYRFLNDQETLDNLSNLGVLPKTEYSQGKSTIVQQVADIGKRMNEKLDDEQVQTCIDQLKEEEMLAPEKIPDLVRDGRFHIILDSLLK